MNSYFVPVKDDDIFFFTREMADEYIKEAVEFCSQELDKLASQKEGADEYLLAWDNIPRSMLESTMNTRDIGMYRIYGTKRYTISDRIYRSDQEVNAKPSAFALDKDFTYFHYPIVEGMLPPDSLEAVPVSYMEIAHADCMKEVFKTIANAQTGVLFHCTAGKDRTGVVSAILLALVGVSDEDIIYDYTISREFHKQRLEAFLKEHPENDRKIVLANEKSMGIFWEMFREKHDSVEQYLLDIGVTSDEIQTLE